MLRVTVIILGNKLGVMNIKPLPPLNSLVAFEAAARYLSFTQAARELSVTQGAVSRQVRLLENYLGKALFERSTRAVALTPTGSQYYQIVAQSLGDISQATRDIWRWQGEGRVTVATTQAMAALWLLPRVNEFQQRYEEIDLRILATDQVQDWQQLDCDIALFYCRQPPTHLRVTPLFPEQVFPVCSPLFLSQCAWQTAADLLSTKLLHLESVNSDWIDWAEWLTHMGLDNVQPRHHTSMNNYPMLLQAAASGQGMALAWSALVDDYLQGGALVRPLDLVMDTPAHFCMLEPPQRYEVPESVQIFRDWLQQQLPALPSEHPAYT